MDKTEKFYRENCGIEDEILALNEEDLKIIQLMRDYAKSTKVVTGKERLESEFKIERLKSAFQETIWMAIRYADGRHTYAPSVVRYAIKQFQIVFPDWKPKPDITIEPPKKEYLGGMSFESDYLHDVF